MSPILLYILIPLCVCGAAAGVEYAILRDRTAWLPWLRGNLLAFAATSLIFAVLHLLTALFMAASTAPFPWWIVLIVSLLILFAFLLPPSSGAAQAHPVLRRFARVTGILCVVLMAAETLVCNGLSYATSYSEVAVELQAITSQEPDDIRMDGDRLEVRRGGIFEITQPTVNVSSMRLYIDDAKTPPYIIVSVKDDNFSDTYKKLSAKQVDTLGGYVDVSLFAYGTLHAVQVELTDVPDVLHISRITFSNARPFAFSSARFLVALGIGLLIAAIWQWRLWTRLYRPKSVCHTLLIVLVLGVCLSVSAGLLVPSFPLSENQIAYPLAKEVRTYDPYVQQFDAFQKGQVSLDIEVDPKLAALPNPYDASQRSERDVPAEWDRAYYDGHYYSYFGVATVLLFYYPYYWVTGALPTVQMTSGVFAILGMIFLFLLILQLVKRFCKRVNLILLLLGLLAAGLTSGILWYQVLSDQYIPPLLCAVCFVMMTLWLGLVGANTHSNVRQIICLGLSGVGCVLTVASRPTAVLMVLLLVPSFIGLLARKDYSARHKLAAAAAFLVPIVVGAIALMLYNMARFDSPFEFGATYQLTMSDIHANSLSLALLPAAIYHYFLQPAAIRGDFPFAVPQYSVLLNYGRYVYVDSSVGAWAFPNVFVSALGIPAVLRRCRKDRVKWFTYLLVPVLALIVAFCDCCLGGVNLRYLSDFLPVLAVFSVPLLLEMYHRLGKLPRLNRRHFPVFAVLMVLAILLAICVLLSFTTGILCKSFPQLVATIERVCIFWR